MTKCAPHKALKLILLCMLTLDERFVVHRLDGGSLQNLADQTGVRFQVYRFGLGFTTPATLGLSVQGLVEIKDTHRRRTLQ